MLETGCYFSDTLPYAVTVLPTHLYKCANTSVQANFLHTRVASWLTSRFSMSGQHRQTLLVMECASEQVRADDRDQSQTSPLSQFDIESLVEGEKQ